MKLRKKRLKNKLKEVALNFFLKVQKPFLEEVLVLGDSHVRVFSSLRLRAKLWRYHLNIVSVSGATASGLENPNSKTQAYQKFDQALTATRAKKVVVMLGEVDTGFVIWYRAYKYDAPVSEIFTKTLLTYGQFLKLVKARGLSPICVSAPLPTIQDGTAWGEVANQRKSVSATQRQRTELTLAFNEEMERLCRAEGIPYLGLDACSLGEDGLVKTELMNRNPFDHHYDKRVFARVLSGRVGSVFERTARTPHRLGQPSHAREGRSRHLH